MIGAVDEVEEIEEEESVGDEMLLGLVCAPVLFMVVLVELEDEARSRRTVGLLLLCWVKTERK